MKKRLLYIFLILCILFLQMPSAVLAADTKYADGKAVDISDLPDPYPQKETVKGIEYTLYDADGNTHTRQNATGKNTLLIYGRPTCSNTMGFINGIKSWKDVAARQGLDVIVVFENKQSVTDSAGQIPFTCTYEHDDSVWERFDFLERIGIGYTYTFPLIVLQNREKEAFYYSTGPVKEPLRVLAMALKEHEHTWGEWKEISPATVASPAKQQRVCSVCLATEEREYGSKLTPTIKVTENSILLKVKQSTTGFAVSGLALGDSVASWKSGNTKILKVSGKPDGTCKLTAQKKAGKTTLTITLSSGLVKKVNVTVQKDNIKTKSIKGVEKKVTLQKGNKFALKPVLNPFTSREKITYASSNKKTATVSSKGVIKAVAPGTAKITVKSGTKKAVCTVKVTKKKK